MKKKDIQIVIKGRAVTCFEPLSYTVTFQDGQTWYSVEGVVLDKPKTKKRARRE
jgi:hypothetical protein